jgi:hypothetical protein
VKARRAFIYAVPQGFFGDKKGERVKGIEGFHSFFVLNDLQRRLTCRDTFVTTFRHENQSQEAR